MKSLLISGLLLLCCMPFALIGAPVILTGNITNGNTVTLVPGTCYLLQSCYNVKSGATLNIPAGVTVLADPGAFLVAEPGSQLNILGTSTSPVIFTSSQAPGLRAAGDWGGIAIAGLAPINDGPANLPCGLTSVGGAVPTYNGGTIEYLQVHFAGGNTSPDMDNALSFYAIGTGTTVKNIQVTYSGGNGIGIYGGTQDMEALFVYNPALNGIKFTHGNISRVNQVGVSFNDVNINLAGEANGIVFQNNDRAAIAYTGTPLTAPVISNASILQIRSCVGELISVDPLFKHGILFRQNGGGSFYNSVIDGVQTGAAAVFIDGDQSIAKTASNQIQVSNNDFFNNAADHGFLTSSTWTGVGGCNFNMAAWMGATSLIPPCNEQFNYFGLTEKGYDPSVCEACPSGSVSYTVDNTVTGFELEFSDYSWYVGVWPWELEHRGAIQQDDLWTSWTDFCPDASEYVCEDAREKTLGLAAGAASAAGFELFPNPASENVVLRSKGHEGVLSVHVADISGRVLQEATLTGNGSVTLRTGNFSSGVYFIRILQDGQILDILKLSRR